MKCVLCKNILFCDRKKDEPDLSGCTSGEPELLPGYVAESVLLYYVKRASSKLGMDPNTYIDAVAAQAKLLMGGEQHGLQKGDS